MPTQMFGYSEWSSTLIRTPPPTTTRAVAVTITLAAMRIDGGWRRKSDIRRSTRLGLGASRRFRPKVAMRRRRPFVVGLLPLSEGVSFTLTATAAEGDHNRRNDG